MSEKKIETNSCMTLLRPLERDLDHANEKALNSSSQVLIKGIHHFFWEIGSFYKRFYCFWIHSADLWFWRCHF